MTQVPGMISETSHSSEWRNHVQLVISLDLYESPQRTRCALDTPLPTVQTCTSLALTLIQPV